MVFTSLGMTVLGLGTAAVDEIGGPLQVLRSDGPGGVLARYLVPVRRCRAIRARVDS